MQWTKKPASAKRAASSNADKKREPGYTVTPTPDGKYVIVRSKSNPRVTHRVRVGPSKAQPFATHL